MLHSAKIPLPNLRRGVFHSLRFQLLTVLAIGVALPTTAVVGVIGGEELRNPSINHSIGGALVIAILFVLFIRRMGQYPGTRVVRYILPTLATMYGLFLSGISLARIDYSNSLLLACFGSTLIARYAIATLNFRGPQVLHCLVPGGRIGSMSNIASIAAVQLEEPILPPPQTCTYVADLHHDHTPAWERFLAEAAINGCPVFHYKQIWEAATGMVQIEHLSENSFGSLLPTHSYRKIKRLVDLVFSIVAAPIVLPVVGLAAGLVRLDSPGPAIFTQVRMGYRGQPFRVYKLRTMTALNQGHDRDASMTQDGDARITRIGKFLRRTRIDELPQIWNILRGDMSWIGPRPEAVSLSHWYEGELPFYRYRHIVRPGITGWAQVHQGHVTTLEAIDHKLQYDFYYIKHFSYWLDVLIFFKTVRVVLSGFGAR